MLHKSLKIFLLGLLIGGAAGCTKAGAPQNPREVLNEYVNRAFGVKSIGDIGGLKEFTTEYALKDLEKLEEDNKKGDAGEHLFDKAFVEQKIESSSAIKVRDERKVGSDSYSITYELAYKKSSPTSGDTVTTKKHALFIFDKEKNRWLIREVQGIKTFVEHTTEENISATKLGEKVTDEAPKKE